MYLRLDVDDKRGNARLKSGVGVRQRTRQVYEALGSGCGHTGQQGYRHEAAFVRSRMRDGRGGGREVEAKVEGPLRLILGRSVYSRCPPFSFRRFFDLHGLAGLWLGLCAPISHDKGSVAEPPPWLWLGAAVFRQCKAASEV